MSTEHNHDDVVADDLARFEQLLRDHAYVPSGLRGVSRCACGIQFHGMPADHRTHVAALLAAECSEAARQAAEEAFREAADEVRRVRTDGLRNGEHSAPYAEHFETWLRNRAASLARQTAGCAATNTPSRTR